MKTVKLPAQGTVFDYYLEPQTRKFLPWSDLVPPFEMEPQTPLKVRAYKPLILTSWTLCATFQSSLTNNHIQSEEAAIFKTNNQQ